MARDGRPPWRKPAAWARDRLLDRGVLRYRPERHAPERFEAGYRSGDFDYYARLDELPRYAVLAGYLTFDGGAPDVLDVGCGRGLLRARLPERAFGSYVGVDLAREAVDAARTLEDGRTRFVQGDARTLDLPTLDLVSVDVVVLNEVLYYLDDAEAFLARVAGWLRPGGRVLTSMWRHPGDGQLWRLVDARFELADRVDVRSERNTMSPRGWRVACHVNREAS